MAILRASTGPYASVRLAVFEPLVVEWCSVPGVSNVLVNVLHRAVPERTRDVAGGTAAPTIGRFSWRLATPPLAPGEPRGPEVPQALVRPSARALALAPEEIARRAEVVRKLLSNERLDLDEMLAQLTSARMPHLLAAGGLRAALSPVGAMHLYRQLSSTAAPASDRSSTPSPWRPRNNSRSCRRAPTRSPSRARAS